MTDNPNNDNSKKYFAIRLQPVKEPYHDQLVGMDNVYLLNGYNKHETKYGPGISFEASLDLSRAVAIDLVEESSMTDKQKRLVKGVLRFEGEPVWCRVYLGEK